MTALKGWKVINKEESKIVLKEEEISKIGGFQMGEGYIEVICGCTSRKFGDTTGKLKVFESGQFLINCECSVDCKEGGLTPEEFEKHADREGLKKWKSNVWVVKDGNKTALWRSGLLKYYKIAANMTNKVCVKRRKLNFHRDEFINCSRCKKVRRFRLRTEQEIKIYHAALMKKNWICSDKPYKIITCEDDEERAGRKSSRGCTRATMCKGCTSCVCFGCLRCRFQNCSCRTCFDFLQNAEP